MRLTAASLTVLCAILGQQARADDPPAPSQPAAPTTTASATATPTPAVSPSAAPGAQQQAAPQAASPVINPGVTVVGAKQDLTSDEKELVNRGYKLEMHDGEKYFCRKEQQLGSRFEHKSCDSAQSLLAHRLDSQEAVRAITSNRPKQSN